MIQLSRSPALSCSRPGHGAEIREPCRDVIERCARRARRARRAEGVGDVVRAAGLEHDRALAERTLEREARGEFSALDRLDAILRREIRGGVRTPNVTMRARGARAAAPIARVSIVGIDDRGGVRPEPATISPSPLATPSRSPNPSRCSAPALVIRSDGRPRERHEFGHIADAIGAHLDHGAAMRRLETHQASAARRCGC